MKVLIIIALEWSHLEDFIGRLQSQTYQYSILDVKLTIAGDRNYCSIAFMNLLHFMSFIH